jgi:hypothetical protein
MKNRLHGTSVIVASALLATLESSGAMAAGRSASMKVSLTVQDTCTIAAATPASDSTSSDLTVHCSGRTPPYVQQDGDFEPQFGKAVRLLAGEGAAPGARYVLRHDAVPSGTSATKDADTPNDALPGLVPTTVVF